ncbi:NADH-quinone oxidoreductase subunit B family protein [Thermococcus paralvinellae]|uniref:Membrane bound hydrogenase, NiFe-hydrogenase small subunit MbhJ n=1 Tax=Thermococcus paralvinellae TaxID=582419 RepID=W0I7X0_9EURY|nr:NADH-quinone oxidoreductase subunit B family protein [Thermococcus paralvinellae]AHF80847.1 Membrane bound hydrogenase, NiFe-hydrogenase small subunit MbhJ [Thermococcus paralvinellae]
MEEVKANTQSQVSEREMLEKRIAKLCKYIGRSPWVFHVNSGSCNGCDIEIIAALTPRYDAERFGVKLVGTPRHADILLVTGPITDQSLERVKLIYEQTPDPKVVIAVGACPTGGSVFYESPFTNAPLDKHIPVDVYVPGCPPRPEAILYGVVLGLEKLIKKIKGEKE